MVIEAIGATNMKKIKKLGTLMAVTTMAPANPFNAAKPPSDICRSICSMFSTSRTTLVCKAPALVF